MSMTTLSGFGAAPAPVQDENSTLVAEANAVAYRTGIREIAPYILRILQLERRVAELEKRTANADPASR